MFLPCWSICFACVNGCFFMCSVQSFLLFVWFFAAPLARAAAVQTVERCENIATFAAEVGVQRGHRWSSHCVTSRQRLPALHRDGPRTRSPPRQSGTLFSKHAFARLSPVRSVAFRLAGATRHKTTLLDLEGRPARKGWQRHPLPERCATEPAASGRGRWSFAASACQSFSSRIVCCPC